MLHRVEGIVIRANDYGENNKVLTVYTKEQGKVALMARGAKKPGSRFAASTQLFVQAVFVYHRQHGMGSLNAADLIDSFISVRKDVLLTTYGACMIELIDRLVDDHIPDGYLYETLYQLLKRLDDGEDPAVLLAIMEVKMLRYAGVDPVLHQCTSCGSVELPFQFSMMYGGALCRECLHKDRHIVYVKPAVMKLLRVFQSINPHRIGKLDVKSESKQQLKLILDLYYQEFVGLKLKSKRFLDQMDAMEEMINRQKDD